MRSLVWPLILLSACTSVEFARLPSVGSDRIFITQESLGGGYESLGLVQITRRGVLLFGFADPAGTDLVAAVEQLDPEVRLAGADGVMNARVKMSQYSTFAKILGAIFFFFPLPSEVTITGELVRIRQGLPAPMTQPPVGAPL